MTNVPLGSFKGVKVSVQFGGVIAFVACFQSEDGTFFCCGLIQRVHDVRELQAHQRSNWTSEDGPGARRRFRAGGPETDTY